MGDFSVSVDEDKCEGCGECEENCPCDVFEIIDGKASPESEDECLGCETCVEVCEAGAITITEN